MKQLFLVGLALGVAATAFSQEIQPWDKKAEKAKFHSKKVVGMLASQTAASYAKRLQMEVDSPFSALLWRNVGPEVQGGRVVMINAPENKPNQIYVAFATGGLYRTEDDGQSWTSVWENMPCFGIGDFAVSKDGQTIYVGGGEANNQRTSYAGTGMYKSTDAGKTWQFVGLPESHHVARIIIDPKDENTVWAATMGHLYSENPERGLYKTTDGGKTWTQVLKKDDWTGCTDIQLDPKNSKIAIAAMYERDRRAWNFLESGEGSGMYRTEDGGKTWTPITTLPSGERCGRTGLAWSRSNAKVVYAFVENPGKDEEWEDEDERAPGDRLTLRRFAKLDAEVFMDIDKDVLKSFWNTYGPRDSKLEDVLKGLKDKKMTMVDVHMLIEKRNPKAFDPGQNNDEIYRSTDGGKTFQRMRKVGELGGYYYDRVFVNPTDENDLWLTGVPLIRSRDGGKTWTQGTNGRVHVDYHTVYFDPRSKGTIWVGNDGGAYFTRNDGESWDHIENLSVGQSTTLAVDDASPYNIYTGLQDNGTEMGPSTYTPGRSRPDQWQAIGGGDGSAVAVDPRGDLVFVASQFGAHQAHSLKGGQNYSARPRTPRGEEARANWVSPIIISSFHPDIVYVGFNKLYRSFDSGRNYTAISPDLTREKPDGDVPYSTLKDISESPIRFGLIYCGADDGRVTMTPDGGFTWKDIPTPEPDKWVSRIVASRWDEGTVYCSQSGYREDDWSAYLWKSTDFGKTWTSIVGNLPAETINVVREDPKNKDILYVGTDMGVFITFDGGKTWEALQGGLSHLPVHDMVIQEREDDLVIATHARGCYVLNLKMVRSITPDLRKEDLKILSLSDGIRSSSWGYERRPEYSSEMPKSPTAKVSFFAGQAGKAKLEIVDKDGKSVLSTDMTCVKGFNFGEIPLRLSDEKFDDIKPTKPKTGADAVKDPFEANRAKYLAAGTYKVVITLNGKKVEKEWKLE
ncbi:MAG: glycosyl hydrolase [Armatimonadetes bacterium]|nr:glycosyl hydrolase [Armatimonadota bacterium]